MYDKTFAITSALQNKRTFYCLVLGGKGNNSLKSDLQQKYIKNSTCANFNY